jgi:hypothetical protein
MAAETDHFMTGDIFFFIFHQGSAMAFEELINPSEVADGAFTGGILGQIAGGLHGRGRRQKKSNRQD